MSAVDVVRIVAAWAHRRRAWVCAGIAVLVLVSVAGVRRITFDTDVVSLLPSDGRATAGFRRFLEAFGSLDQLYVVLTAPDGHTVGEYAEQVEQWKAALATAPEIERVDAGLFDSSRDLAWLADRQLLLLAGARLDEALARLHPAGLGAAIAARRELLAMPSSNVLALVQQDPVGLVDLVQAALTGGDQALASRGADAGTVSPDGRSQLITAHPRLPPFDATFSRALDARMQRMRAQMAAAGATAVDEVGDALPPLHVDVAGGHRIAVETEAFVRRESITNSVGSLALILPLLFFVFRSPWLVAIGALPSALSLLVVLGGLGFAGATLSAAATGAAAMLFGLGVDGVVLVYVAHRLTLADGVPADGAVAATAGPSLSMLLGMATTAATFYGLMFVDFPSLQELGRLIGHTMVVCGVLTLLLVSAFLPRRAPKHAPRSLLMPRLATSIARHRRAILLSAAGITVVLGMAAVSWLRVNPTLDRLRSVTAAARLEARLAETFGLPQDISVVLTEGPELEPLLAATERLTMALATDVPGVPVQSATGLLPSLASQNLARQQIRASGLSASAVRVALDKAAADAGFRPGAFAAFADRLPALLDTTARLTYDDYVARGWGDIVHRFVTRTPDGWVLATYVFPEATEQMDRVQQIVAADPSMTLTGLPAVNRELAARFLPEFAKGLAIGSLVVLALILVAFRAWRLSLLALLPTGIGLIWTAGVLAVAGVELDLFALFAVVTLVGIGVDYGIHMVYRYQERGDAERAVAELTPITLVAGAITLAGYGTLITSSYPPLHSIGVVSSISVVALVVASTIVLPALLMEPRR